MLEASSSRSHRSSNGSSFAVPRRSSLPPSRTASERRTYSRTSVPRFFMIWATFFLTSPSRRRRIWSECFSRRTFFPRFWSIIAISRAMTPAPSTATVCTSPLRSGSQRSGSTIAQSPVSTSGRSFPANDGLTERAPAATSSRDEAISSTFPSSLRTETFFSPSHCVTVAVPLYVFTFAMRSAVAEPWRNLSIVASTRLQSPSRSPLPPTICA